MEEFTVVKSNTRVDLVRGLVSVLVWYLPLSRDGVTAERNGTFFGQKEKKRRDSFTEALTLKNVLSDPSNANNQLLAFFLLLFFFYQLNEMIFSCLDSLTSEKKETSQRGRGNFRRQDVTRCTWLP